MHHDVLPLISNSAEAFPHEDSDHPDRVMVQSSMLTAMTAALMVAQSGILSVDDVAAVLRCSVDTVRRIPVDQLPSYDGPGRGILYQMDDVQAYLHGQKRHQKRGAGFGQTSDTRPDPNPMGRNPAADALSGLKAGASA